MFKGPHYLALMVGLTLASAAHANDGELSLSSSSSTVSVSVYIPPIGAALAAAESGAVGLWSVQGRNSGLMIKLHPSVSGDGYEAITVYSRAEIGVVTEWDSQAGKGFALIPEKMRGLNKTTYMVPAESSAVQTLTIRGI